MANRAGLMGILRTPDPVWLLSAGIVTLGWALGVAIFATTAEAQDASDIPFALRDLLFPSVVWLALAIGVAWVRVERPPWRWATAAFMVASIVLGIAAFISAWGGYCWSSRDLCVVVPESHLSHLALPLAALLVGWVTEVALRVRRRSTDQTLAP